MLPRGTVTATLFQEHHDQLPWSEPGAKVLHSADQGHAPTASENGLRCKIRTDRGRELERRRCFKCVETGHLTKHCGANHKADTAVPNKSASDVARAQLLMVHSSSESVNFDTGSILTRENGESVRRSEYSLKEQCSSPNLKRVSDEKYTAVCCIRPHAQ